MRYFFFVNCVSRESQKFRLYICNVERYMTSGLIKRSRPPGAEGPRLAEERLQFTRSRVRAVRPPTRLTSTRRVSRSRLGLPRAMHWTTRAPLCGLLIITCCNLCGEIISGVFKLTFTRFENVGAHMKTCIRS
jgi:hypothetical protein